MLTRYDTELLALTTSLIRQEITDVIALEVESRTVLILLLYSFAAEYAAYNVVDS